MKSFFNSFKDKRILVVVTFAVLCIISAFFLPLISVNYDLTKYLPQDSGTAKGFEIFHDEFGENGNLSVMVKDIDIKDAYAFKNQLSQIENIESVIWLDDIIFPYLPEYLTEEMFFNNYNLLKATMPLEVSVIIESYYNGDALFEIVFNNSDYHPATAAAIIQIDELGKVYLSGTSASAYNNNNIIMSQTLRATAIIVPLAVIILIFATKSFIEPFIMLIVIGVAVMLNMATNAVFDSISYMTLATSAILQMALSMDYMIFLNNRFHQEFEQTQNAAQAMKTAVKKCFMPLCASSLTTIAGFIALMFMRYTIGFDLGIVLAKGIILSILCVFTLMPPIYMLMFNTIKKTTHKTIPLEFKGFGKFLKKTRFILPPIFIIAIIFGGIFQSGNMYLYGESSSMGSEGSRLYTDKAEIQSSFGNKNPLVILLPNTLIEKEGEISYALSQTEGVTSVNGYSVMANIAQSMGSEPPKELQNQFIGENYYRIILNLETEEETEYAFAIIHGIKSLLQNYGNEYYLLGQSASVLDIKEVVDYDFTAISFISIGLVALILLFSFKSLLMPVLLIAVIQGSIWINMAVPYILNQPLMFIGSMIVSCLQLGATIDYGILLAGRYVENRKIHPKNIAIEKAINQSAHSIVISAVILFISGIILSVVSSMSGIAAIGILIARGTAASALLVFLLLPHLLTLCDKGIKYTTLKSGFIYNQKNKKL